MKKLSRVVLRSAHRVLNAQEMKSVVGGQVIDDNCREISGSPQMAIDSGGINQFPQTCKKVYEKGADANRMLVLCRCE